MKILLSLALWTICTSVAFGTFQIPDQILLDGQKYELFSTPLEIYLEKHPDKKPKDYAECTGLWRGYIATFEVTEGRLRLKDLEILAYRERGKGAVKTSVIDSIFPNQESRRATWFSGILVVPLGDKSHNAGTPFPVFREPCRLLYISNGEVQTSADFSADDYNEYRQLQLEQFKKTESFQKLCTKFKLVNKGYNNSDCENRILQRSYDYLREVIVDYKNFRPTQSDKNPGDDRATTTKPPPAPPHP